MSLFNIKNWTNRISEFPVRRKLTNVSTGDSSIVDVAREEGMISAEGDAFSADTMNDLEARVAAAIGAGDIPTELGTDIVGAIGALNSKLIKLSSWVTITTDIGGNALVISNSGIKILSMWSADGTRCIPYYANDDWYVSVTDYTLTLVPNHTMAICYAYCNM